jgi:hypothetical protein
MNDQDDIPASRDAMELVTTPFKIIFMLVFALLSGVLFLIGLFRLPPGDSSVLKQIPEPVQFICIGILGFTLFFPWFMILYFARHLLVSIKRLEQENAELRGSARRNPDPLVVHAITPESEQVRPAKD